MKLPDTLPLLDPRAVPLLLAAALLLAVVALVVALRTSRRAAGMMGHYRRLTAGADGLDLATLLEAASTRLSAAERRLDQLEQSTRNLDRDLQRIGQAETGIQDLRHHTADLGTHVQRIGAAEGGLQGLQRRLDGVDSRLRQALQRVGFLRYQAYEDTGGDQSFALALLDDGGDGLVLSGLHGRSASRVYAKPVADGRSSYALSEEEQAAIAAARGEER